MYYSCEEHIDIAMEEVIDESEQPPKLELISEKEKDFSASCSFCNNEAKYIVQG